VTRAPAVTVLIPTHNRADVLPFAIRSVLAQTFTDLELFVVGDGCTDDTAGVVTSFGDPRVRWFDLPKAPNFGYANRNVALREARGELVAYLGHDDLWLPDHLEILTSLIAGRDVGFVASRGLLVAPDGTIRQHVFNLEDPEMIRRVLRAREGFSPSTVVHRRDYLHRFGYWDERLPRGGDTDLWMRFLRGNGGRAGYAQAPTSFHFVAEWRAQTGKSKLLDTLRRLDGAAPPELVVPVAPGLAEQQVVWREIEADPAGFTERIRRGARIDSDRLARMEWPSSLAYLAWGQWQHVKGRTQSDDVGKLEKFRKQHTVT
jgi:glycosyltransferase involved in cell wall biosynthesis